MLNLGKNMKAKKVYRVEENGISYRLHYISSVKKFAGEDESNLDRKYTVEGILLCYCSDEAIHVWGEPLTRDNGDVEAIEAGYATLFMDHDAIKCVFGEWIP
jgi:hypothetical protein